MIYLGDYNVYAGAYDGIIAGIDSAGNELWFTRPFGDTIRDGAYGNEYMYYGYDNGEISKIDPATGDLVRRGLVANHYIMSLVLRNDDTIYISTYDNEVRKIDSSGNVVWTYTGHNTGVFGLEIDLDGNIYSGDSNGKLHKIDNDGNNIWIADKVHRIRGITIDNSGNIYYGNDNGTVFKLDSDGNQIWYYNITGNDVCTDLTTGDTPYIYSSSWSGHVEKIDTSGSSIWTYWTSSRKEVVRVDQDGFVYAGGGNDIVHKILTDGSNYSWLYSELRDWVQAVAVEPGTYSGGFLAPSETNVNISIPNKQVTTSTYSPEIVLIVLDNLISLIKEQVSSQSYSITHNTTSSYPFYASSISNEFVKLREDFNQVYWDVSYAYDIEDFSINLKSNIGASICSDNHIRTLNLETGDAVSFDSEDFTAGLRSIAIDLDSNIYVSHLTTLKKFDSNLNLIWSYESGSNATYSVAVDKDKYIYVSDNDSFVHKVSPSGNLEYKFNTNTTRTESIALDLNKNIYTGGYVDDNLEKRDNNGNLIWNNTDAQSSIRATAVDNEFSYIGTYNGNVYKIRNSDGVLEWTFSQHTNTITDIDVNPDGTVYSSSLDNNVFGINPDGTLKSQINTVITNDAIMVTSDPGLYGARMWPLQPKNVSVNLLKNTINTDSYTFTLDIVSSVNININLLSKLVSVVKYTPLIISIDNIYIDILTKTSQVNEYIPTIRISKIVQVNAPPKNINVNNYQVTINTSQNINLNISKKDVNVNKFDLSINVSRNVSLDLVKKDISVNKYSVNVITNTDNIITLVKKDISINKYLPTISISKSLLIQLSSSQSLVEGHKPAIQAVKYIDSVIALTSSTATLQGHLIALINRTNIFIDLNKVDNNIVTYKPSSLIGTGFKLLLPKEDIITNKNLIEVYRELNKVLILSKSEVNTQLKGLLVKAIDFDSLGIGTITLNADIERYLIVNATLNREINLEGIIDRELILNGKVDRYIYLEAIF